MWNFQMSKIDLYSLYWNKIFCYTINLYVSEQKVIFILKKQYNIYIISTLRFLKQIWNVFLQFRNDDKFSQIKILFQFFLMRRECVYLNTSTLDSKQPFNYISLQLFILYLHVHVSSTVKCGLTSCVGESQFIITVASFVSQGGAGCICLGGAVRAVPAIAP